jgi:hypothetical protein
MAKAQAPRVATVESENLNQIMRIQTEIDSLDGLKNKNAIDDVELSNQVNQRQQAQLLLFRMSQNRPVSPTLAPGEKGILVGKMDEVINDRTKTKQKLEEELEKTAKEDSKGRRRIEVELDRIDGEIPLLKKVEAMINAK